MVLDERLRRGFSDGIPCGRRAFFQQASLRRSRRSRPSPLLRLALWKNSSPRYQPGFFNRLLGKSLLWMGGGKILSGAVRIGNFTGNTIVQMALSDPLLLSRNVITERLLESLTGNAVAFTSVP